MGRYGVFVGANPVPIYTGDDAADANALRVEDPIGTVVYGVGPAGSQVALGRPPQATGATPANFFGTSPRVARATYSFAVNGGLVSTIPLFGALNIPNGAIIIGGGISIPVTVPASGGGATISVGLNTTTDLLAAAAISGAPWSTTGYKAIIPVFTAASAVVATAARDISITIGTAALTAGIFDVWVVYLF